MENYEDYGGRVFKRHYEDDLVQVISTQDGKLVCARLHKEGGTRLTQEQLDKKVESGAWEEVEEPA